MSDVPQGKAVEMALSRDRRAERPRSCRWSFRFSAVATVFFIVVFMTVHWLTRVQPYATLHAGENCNLILFSPDSTSLVTVGESNCGPLRVWNVQKGIERFAVASDWNVIKPIHFSPDGGLLAAHECLASLKLWDARAGNEVASVRPKTPTYLWSFRFTPDGKQLVFQDGKGGPDVDHITFWNIDSKQEQGSVENNSQTLNFSATEGTFATIRRKHDSKVTHVLLWKTSTLQAPVLCKEYPVQARQVAFSPDLKMFATGNNLSDCGEVVCWDMATGVKRFSVRFDQQGTYLRSLSFEAGGRILSAHGSGGHKDDWHWLTTAWDLTTSPPREIGFFSEKPVISSDGKWLAIPLDTGVKLLNLSTREEGDDLIVDGDVGPKGVMYEIRKNPAPFFSPDGKIIAVKGLHAWGQQPLNNVLPPNFNPFSRDPSGWVVRAWDVASGEHLMVFTNCTDAQFSPDGRVFATLNDEGMVNLWNVPFRKPIWYIFGWTALIWLVAICISWLMLMCWRWLRSG